MGTPGEVYILHNCSLREGLVKIGLTTRTAEKRANELRTTGVPGKFQVLFSQVVDDALGIEKRLHARFQEFRYDDDREFFYVSPARAITALLEEAGILPSTKSEFRGDADVLVSLRLRYGPLLDPELTAVKIEGGGDAPTTLQCSLRRAGDDIVFCRDLDFITAGEAPYFEPAIDAADAARLFLELDSYTLIMTTPVFSRRGAQLVADLWERWKFGEHEILEVIKNMKEVATEQTIDSIESLIRGQLNLPSTKLDIVSVHEHAGRFLLSAHRDSAPVRDIHVEAIVGDDCVDAQASHAVITRESINELQFDEIVDIGYRFSPATWTTDGPRIQVTGMTPEGIPFEQRFWFMP